MTLKLHNELVGTMSRRDKIIIFALSAEHGGISGSETILVETFKRIDKNIYDIDIYTWKPGKDMYMSLGLVDVKYIIARIPFLRNWYLSFILRVIYSLYIGISISISSYAGSKTILYPGSDFWMDFIPAIITKCRHSKCKLIGTYYLKAPNPFYGYTEYSKRIVLPRLNSIFYWLMQLPVVPLYNRLADIIFITSKPDESKFPNKKTYIVKGGVDLESIDFYKKNHKNNSYAKSYDCVFMGRFHPQKGVVELIEIWQKIVGMLPEARLIMIGDGPLFFSVQNLIKELNLSGAVTLTGYITDTNRKYDIFSSSKIVVHPALYDSGGMAAAEAMAFCLPAVSYDLEALKTYYPSGMLKIPPYEKKLFADAIYKLLTDRNYYSKMSEESARLIYSSWGWKEKSREIQSLILSL